MSSQSRVRALGLAGLRYVLLGCALAVSVSVLGSFGAVQNRNTLYALLFHKPEPPPILEVPSICPSAFSSGPFSELNAMIGDSGKLWFAEKVFTLSRTIEFSASPPYTCERELERFSPEEGIRPTSMSVGHLAGKMQVYVGYREGEVKIWDGESGTELERWNIFGGNEVTGVAVDNSPEGPTDWAADDVLVALGSQHIVDVLAPTVAGGEKAAAPPLTGISPSEPFRFPEDVAVDDVNGDVFIVDSEELGHNENRKFIDMFEPGAPGEYRFVRKITGTPSGLFGIGGLSIAVDSSTEAEGEKGQLYASQGGNIGEFSLTGKFLGAITSESIQEEQPGGSLAGGVAVDTTTHHVFASAGLADGQRAVDGFGENVVIPDVKNGPFSNFELDPESHLWDAELHGEANPDDAGEATCWFVWGTSTSYGNEAPCGALIPNGNSFAGVQGKLVGLESDASYHYRLRAKNGSGTNFGEEREDQELTTPGPGIHSESAVEVASSSVTLQASINPNEDHTSYRFEYDTSPYEGQGRHGASLPSADSAIGAGKKDVEVEEKLTGLLPGTVYHYRVVAISEVDVKPGDVKMVEFDGPDKMFTTQMSGSPLVLPDGRTWELVSPVNKHGALIRPISSQGVPQASADGNAFTFVTLGATESEPQGNPEAVQVLASRCGGGWSSQDISLPHAKPIGLSIGQGFEYQFFSEDLSSAIAESLGPFSPPEFEHVSEASPEATERTPYLRHDSICRPPQTTPYEPLVSATEIQPPYEELPPGTEFGGNPEQLTGDVNFLGAAPDAGHVVLGSSVQLTSVQAPNGGLYEWSADAGSSGERLQLVSLLPGGSAPAPNPLLGGAHEIGSSELVRDAISDDGDRVFWTESGLYMRDVSKQETVQISSGPAKFQAASGDGSRVFFTQGGEGTLLEYDVGSSPVVLATGVLGDIVGASDDGSYVYFVARERLAEGAVAGEPNLYVAHDSVSGWETSLVATLSDEDSPDWGFSRYEALARLAARVSPNGQWLVFMSDRSLTGYDNRDAVSGVPDEEVYLYNVGGGKVVCASCDPTSARPVGTAYEPGRLTTGWEVWPPGRYLAASVPGWTSYRLDEALYQSRYLSNNGRLFFNSSDALVPQDTNGNEDVYEFEPVGVGSCRSSSTMFVGGSGGCLGLISSGVAFGESAFLDASETGGDVFFLTAERLVPKDVDTSYDVYDAHECAAQSPCPAPEAAPPPECVSAASCRAAPLVQPLIFGPPASQTFMGEGNLSPGAAVSPPPPSPQPTWKKKLEKALKMCGRDRSRRRRIACEGKARKRYRPVKVAKQSAKRRAGR
jgi:WD40-like Beta Propeller Repeat